nr:alpha-protein kinase 2 isoform X2 [Zootoca vivipara]
MIRPSKTTLIFSALLVTSGNYLPYNLVLSWDITTAEGNKLPVFLCHTSPSEESLTISVGRSMMSGSESSVNKSAPYFLSTLSSVSVPENGDTMFSCKISGSPKPEVTWYKNGQDISQQKNISSCEILEDNLTQVLHLFRCTEQQAGVYKIVAKNCFGTAQSSAFLKVTSDDLSEAYQNILCSPEENIETCRGNEVTVCQQKFSDDDMENKEALAEKQYSLHECCFYLGSPEPPAPEFSDLSIEQMGETFFHTVECETCPPLENHSSGDEMKVKNASNLKDYYHSIRGMSNHMPELFIYESTKASRDSTEGELDDVDFQPASQITDHTDSCCLNAEVLAACQTTEYAKTHEEGSFSKPLKNSTLSGNQTSVPLGDQICFLGDSSKNASNNIVLCLERNFITVDESSDDDSIEYFECSDVMTEETYKNWESKLKFLLESDDEEDELIPGSDCDGCAYFLSEMPRLFQVSDNTVPMEATIGFCGHQSKSKEVAVRSDLTAYSSSTLQAEMTLTVGQQQSKTSSMKDKEKYKLSATLMAIENDCPRMEEENSSSNHSAVDVSVVGSQGIENGISAMKSSSCDLSGSLETASKRVADKYSSRKNSQQFAKVRKKPAEGKSRVEANRIKTSKDTLNSLHPKERHTSEIHTLQMERSCLDPAALLHRQGESISNQGSRDIVNASNHITLFHGEEREKGIPWESKWISDLSERTQVSHENAALMVQQQETDSDNTVPISGNLKLFITEPVLDERFVFKSSPVKSPASEKSASEKVSGKNGFPTGSAVLENSAGLCVSNGTHNEREPCWDQTLHLTIMDDTASRNVPPGAQSHPSVTSKQEGLCDILTPLAVPNIQTERAKAYGGKPHESNEVKAVDNIPCAQYLSKADSQGALEAAEPEVRDAALSSMHEQLQMLLYEGEDWGCDFTCASSKVESSAAGTDAAKEVEGLNIAGDVSTRQHVPGNLTEDNQLVTELAGVMKVHTDYCSALKRDGACSRTSTDNSSLALPAETDAMCPCSAFGHKTEKPSVHPLSSNIQKEKPDHNRSAHMSAYQEETIMTDGGFQSCGVESPFKLTEAPDDPLEHGQEMLSGLPANYPSPLSCIEQIVHCTDGPKAKQANEMPTKESHVTLRHSRIKECANLAELALKEDSSSNFSGKNNDQFGTEEHFSITAVDKSVAEKFQEKGTESEMKAQSDNNCDIYHVLRGNNSKDVQAVSDAQNCSYHTEEHSSVLATGPKAVEGNEKIEGRKAEPVFTASYKVRFYTEVLLEINKNNENDTSEENRDFGTSIGQTALECKYVMPPSDSQQTVSEKKSSITDHLGLGLDFSRSPLEPCKSAALNTVQPSSIIRNECHSTGQENQNASHMVGNLIVCAQHKILQESICEGCSTNELVSGKFDTNAPEAVESLRQTESMQVGDKKDKDEHWQNQYERVVEKSNTQTVQCERERQMSISHDPEETEVEPYMRNLIDSEHTHSWHENSELQQDEYQHVGRESQTRIIPCERGARETQKSTECNLEEVEPYMRALINSEQMYSWHDITDFVHPFVVLSSEQAGVSEGGLVGDSVVPSIGHNRATAFTDGERQSLNSSEHAIGALVSVLPCASKNSHHSQEQLPQVKIQPFTSGATAGEGKTKSQESSKPCKAPSHHTEDVKRKQETVKKKMAPKVQIKKPRLEAKENVCNHASCVKKVSKTEAGPTHKEDKREQRKLPCKKDSKAPKLVKKIQAELFPDLSGNIKLCCQFSEIHEDSTITWTKDSKLLAQVHRSAGDDFPVSLAIVQAGKKDQGLYHCCLKNMYGKASAEFNLTSEVLEHLSSLQDVEGLEEIEFLQLMFREDFISDSYFSNSLHGRIITEELHFGEGVHRKAFRSKVMQGLVPVFGPGHPCVLKVHNAIAYGTRNNDELMKKNYKLALQECYVQNTAREYAKIYAAETKPLEGFGEVPEIIPIFLVHRPKNNVPYATVEEELIGEFVKYSIRDGKEINFLRRDSEAGQKCCTFQHWVYERTSGSLLVTDMQGTKVSKVTAPSHLLNSSRSSTYVINTVRCLD